MSLPPGYFDDLYAAADDPWGMTTRWYERRKYALTLASLPRERYRSGLELGCSVGVLTAALAARCDTLLAVDASPLALAQAATRVPPSVTLVQAVVPAGLPVGEFDLVVVSEVAYYLDRVDLAALVAALPSRLASGGHLVAVHWRHPVADYPLGGDEVQAALRAASGLAVLASHVEEDFVLDVLVAGEPVSVARAEGLR